MAYCEQSGKFMYESWTAADVVLNKKKKLRGKHKPDNKRFVAKLDSKQTTVYKCPWCNKYHLAGK